ncbi:hypothetical protein HKD37_03G006907 [Glycine soja]
MLASQGSFVPHGRQDVLTVAIGRQEHPGHVRAAGAGLIQQIKDQLEESITAADVILQPDAVPGLALPLEPEVGPSTARVSTKESYVDPSGNDPDTGDSDKCRLYIKENPPRLVALGRVYEGSTTIHNIPLLHDQVKVDVEEVKDADALILVLTEDVILVGQALNTFLVWPTHLVKRLSKHVMWDATMFRVFNEDFPLYLKNEYLSEITHGGQCLSIFVIQLCILHLTETSMRAENSDVYGFLEPQSIQRFGLSQFESESYMKNWMQNSKQDVYLQAYLNGPNNYLKGIINRLMLFFNTFALALVSNMNILMFLVFNSALKGLDDTPQPKSKVGARWIIVKCNRQKGSTECGYYVMHWMLTIIIRSFKNNWETYFNDVGPLEAERLKALCIQWAKYYLKVRTET